jgi:hypothetical protein
LLAFIERRVQKRGLRAVPSEADVSMERPAPRSRPGPGGRRATPARRSRPSPFTGMVESGTIPSPC